VKRNFLEAIELIDEQDGCEEANLAIDPEVLSRLKLDCHVLLSGVGRLQRHPCGDLPRERGSRMLRRAGLGDRPE